MLSLYWSPTCIFDRTLSRSQVGLIVCRAIALRLGVPVVGFIAFTSAKHVLFTIEGVRGPRVSASRHGLGNSIGRGGAPGRRIRYARALR
jgi:hypothetical protein